MSRTRSIFAAMAIALLASAAGCDSSGSTPIAAPPTTGRSNAVAASTGPAFTGAQASTSARAPGTMQASGTTQAPATAPTPRKLCVGQTARPTPRGMVETAAVSGTAELPKSIPFGVGKWVWLNLWAAWCKPCKEEMPRLIEWQKRLMASGVLLELAFVSIDDDKRQLQRFIEEQPASGVRASYWLPEGGVRGGFLGGLGLKESTELPAHAFVAPSGQVQCVFQGAVEERDYPQIAALFGAKL